MNILHVTVGFFPATRFGGTVQTVLNISRELVKKGHNISVWTTNALDKRRRISKGTIQNVIEGISITYLKCHNLIGDFVTPSLPRLCIKSLREFDIIHLNGYRNSLCLVTGYYARKYGIPYILSAHGTLPPEAALIKSKVPKKKIYDAYLGKKLLRGAKFLTAISKNESQQYCKMGIDRSKIEVIYNGLNLDEFLVLPQRGSFRKKYGISEKYGILYLGRIHRRKGIEHLVQAFNLSKYKNDSCLCIIGPDDGYKSTVRSVVRQFDLDEKVSFIDHLNAFDKLEALVDADVLVYPGAYEYFGLVPFEAIMCGTPVIVTDDSGCGEIIREIDGGYLVPYGNVDVLKDKIDCVLENLWEAKKKTERERAYIKSNLTWEKIVTKLEEVYKKALVSGKN